MKAGFAERVITPPDGTERAGCYTKLYLSGKRDDLKTRVAVFAEENETVAIVGIDVCTIGKISVDRIKSKIFSESGIKPEKILVAASHTHSGASLWGFHNNELKDAPEIIKKLALELSPSISGTFEDIVVDKTAAAVKEAMSGMNSKSFNFGCGHEKDFVFNRRLKMKNGRAYTHPGKGNPDIESFAGPVDPDVAVIGAWQENGRLAGCIVNYACHCTAWSSTVISADWVASMEKTIKSVFGEHVVVVFLNGACGDITQVDNIGKRINHTTEEWLTIIGTRVGAEAVKVLVSADRGSVTPLKAVMENLPLKRRTQSKDKLEKSLKIAAAGLSDPSARKEEWIWAKERVIANYIAEKEPVKNVPIQAIQIGPAVILANPAEYFCKLGLDIKAKSEFPLTIISELSNDCVGYVPTTDAFSENGGGYETVLTSYSNLEVSAGDKIAELCVKLAAQFNPGKMPSAPEIEKNGTPWSYGVLGPEKD